MKISTSTGRIFDYCGVEAGLKMIADAGFEAIDQGIDVSPRDREVCMHASDVEYAAYFKDFTQKERVRVIHVHDNGGMLDDHLLPGRGITNWQRFARTLGAVGYSGTFNFETSMYFSDFNKKEIVSEEVFRSACSLLCAVGRSLAGIAEGTFQPV